MPNNLLLTTGLLGVDLDLDFQYSGPGCYVVCSGPKARGSAFNLCHAHRDKTTLAVGPKLSYLNLI